MRTIETYNVLDDLSVHLGHTVHTVGDHDSQVGHANLLLITLLNDGELVHLGNIVGPLLLDHLGQEQMVDVVDDLNVSGEEVLHETEGPHFQGLRQDGVVCVSESPIDRISYMTICFLLSQIHTFRRWGKPRPT